MGCHIILQILYTGRLQDIPDLGQQISETGAGPRIFYVIKSFFVCVYERKRRPVNNFIQVSSCVRCGVSSVINQIARG